MDHDDGPRQSFLFAAAAVMVPRSGRWADLDGDSILLMALKALKADVLGGRATCCDNEDEVQPIRLSFTVVFTLSSQRGKGEQTIN